MPKFNEIAHKGTCDVCGKQADVAVCASSCGPISLAYCRDCLELTRIYTFHKMGA